MRILRFDKLFGPGHGHWPGLASSDRARAGVWPAQTREGGIRLGELRAELGNRFGAAIVRFREILELRASSAAAQNRAETRGVGYDSGGYDSELPCICSL